MVVSRWICVGEGRVLGSRSGFFLFGGEVGGSSFLYVVREFV